MITHVKLFRAENSKIAKKKRTLLIINNIIILHVKVCPVRADYDAFFH